MPEDFETDALHYLLGEMSEARRSAFEEQLARDPSARAALKAYADALAGFAGDTAPAEPMLPADQRVALTTILAATETQDAPAATKQTTPWWSHYFWPAAAALLLGVNLLDFERPFDAADRAERPRTIATSEPPAERAGEPAKGESGATGNEEPVENEAPSVEPVMPRDVPEAFAAGETPGRPSPDRQLVQLRQDYAELQRTNSILRADYEAVLRHLADRALIDKGVGRLAAMELVDARSYQRGERKGLLEVARTILTEPGVVVVDTNVPPPVAPPVTPPTLPNGEVGVTISPTPNTPAGPATSEPPAPSPYAWAVFDEKENRGYLNLYNLPAVTTDQSLQLWVKTADSNAFQRVGEVPAQMPNGNGSFYYTLPAESLPPAEILVTREPRNAAAAAPSGEVVLRGP